ncbi:MAG: aconitase X catalytic domain-containing protein [Candidatus Bathyarchaeota archaeon]|nr:aconitase X catalytic domain-containing protein [Candidatus Bathyarchaeota archaeon]MDI6805889.1 aconitase X catalytic domain-containing protein [Candidatus Bathyarchaeia archaeon]
MHLTKEEERIYDGEFCWANQVCMKILVRLGELFKAKKLIPISSSHVSGVSYKTLGDAPTEFLEALAKANAKVKVKSTLNPQSLDCNFLCKRLPSDLYEKQMNVLNCFEKMGFTSSLTCTPYYLEKPKKDVHLAWAESSAVVYANSVLGAWTNREGGPSALAAAIIGKTPDYGMHQAENRQPKVLVKLEKPLLDDVEFGALGIFLGKILKDEIPIIQGLEKASKDNLKQLGAALATAGMTNMFYHKLPRIKTEKIEKISVQTSDLKRTIEKLTTTSTKTPDLIFVGCPHCSLNEIRQIAKLIGSRKIRKETEFWVCTSRHIKEKAIKHVKKIERNGGHVLTDTCAVVTWTEKLGIKTIMTNSAKTAHYVPTLNKAQTILAPLKECIKKACEG